MSSEARLQALRGVLCGVSFAWLCKAVLLGHALLFALTSPLSDPFFPASLQSGWLLALALLLPPTLTVRALCRPTSARIRRALLATTLGALSLLLHQATYNDASFLTALWSSLFGLWLHVQPQGEPRLGGRAARHARAVVALMFLGGFVGKLSPGYWDGTVLHALYFAERDHWSFVLLRGWLLPEQLRIAALLYSRAVIVSEGLLVTLPLWPARVGLRVACVALCAMVALHNWLLLSVMGPLLGVCVAALYGLGDGVMRARKMRAASAYSGRAGSADASAS